MKKQQTRIPTEKERRRITYKLRVMTAEVILRLYNNRLVKWAKDIVDRDQRIHCDSDRVGKGYGTVIRFEDVLYKNLDNFSDEEVIMREFWPYFRPEAQRLMEVTVKR